MTTYLLYGHAGSSDRAWWLSRTEGVHWASELDPGDVIIVEPLGLVRLLPGGVARQSHSEGLMIERPGEPLLVLWPLLRYESWLPTPPKEEQEEKKEDGEKAAPEAE